MTSGTISNELNPQQTITGNRSTNRQRIIWREWRNSQDQEYADHLFKLVGSTNLGWGNATILILITSLYGILVSFLFTLIIRYNHQSEQQLLITFLLTVGFTAAGGIAGIGMNQQITWEKWLYMLTPRMKIDLLTVFVPACFIAGLAGLSPFLGALMGAGLGSLTFLLTFPSSRRREGVSVGIILGAWFGGLLTAVGNIVAISPWSAFLASLLIGCWLGIAWQSIVLGIIVGGGIIIVSLLLPDSDKYIYWTGIALGMGFGSALIAILKDKITVSELYAYRFWYFWWRKQPAISQVETALQQTCQVLTATAQVWPQALHKLEQRKKQPDSLRNQVVHLQSLDWIERFSARHTLITMGDKAIDLLKEPATDESSPLHQTAIWLLNGIKAETTYQFAGRFEHILCPSCLTQFAVRFIDLSWNQAFSYYGCRTCGQSREFLKYSASVVAILNSDNHDETYRKHDGALWVNWLVWRKLFDFDLVRIIQATDEEIERFVMQVGNDTDPYRESRYKTMHCLIRPECRLSENSQRILQHTFGHIRQMGAEE